LALIVQREEVTATHDEIEKLEIDVKNRSVSVHGLHGNLDADNNFQEVSREICVVYNKPDGTTDFDDMVSQVADGTNDIYQNVKEALWTKLIELNLVEGSVV
jgi:hypothetical protein